MIHAENLEIFAQTGMAIHLRKSCFHCSSGVFRPETARLHDGNYNARKNGGQPDKCGVDRRWLDAALRSGQREQQPRRTRDMGGNKHGGRGYRPTRYYVFCLILGEEVLDRNLIIRRPFWTVIRKYLDSA